MAHTLDPATVSRALVVWTGWHVTTSPSRNQGEARLASRFGTFDAALLLRRVMELEDDFYASDARLMVSDLAAMGAAAADEFRAAHPEISEEAVQALPWCYTYDFK